MSQRITHKLQSKTEKVIAISSMILGVYPILFYFYISQGASKLNLSIQELLEKDILLTLNMITAFTLGFIGYLLFQQYKKIENPEEIEVVQVNLLLMLISQIVVLNIFGISIFIYIIYLVNSRSSIKFFEAIRRKKGASFGNCGGSLLALVINIIIMLITLRLNFV